jgi:hypothetical protein
LVAVTAKAPVIQRKRIEMRVQLYAAASVFVVSTLAAPLSAQPAPTSLNYNFGNPVNGSGTCSLSDLWANGSVSALQCWGWYEINSGQSAIQAVIISDLLDPWRNANTASTNSWEVLGTTNAGGAAATFVAFMDEQKAGTLTLGGAYNPISGVFAVALKGGSQSSIYVFNTAADVSTFNFEMSNDRALSNATLFRLETPVVVPEPASLALLLTGLAGLGVAARRRRSR